MPGFRIMSSLPERTTASQSDPGATPWLSSLAASADAASGLAWRIVWSRPGWRRVGPAGLPVVADLAGVLQVGLVGPDAAGPVARRSSRPKASERRTGSACCQPIACKVRQHCIAKIALWPMLRWSRTAIRQSGSIVSAAPEPRHRPATAASAASTSQASIAWMNSAFA